MAVVLALKYEGKTYCCACAERLANESGYPNLFMAMNSRSGRFVRVDSEVVCELCGGLYGGDAAGLAAERLAKLLRG